MPEPYLIQVASEPHKVSPKIWTQWYLEEHLRDMVYFGVAQRASFYRGTSDLITNGDTPKDGSEGRSFLAMFQTPRKHGLRYPAFKEKVRQTTGLFDGRRGREVGE